MLRKIVWSPRAVLEWAEILDYWTKRNKSNTYSLKLDNLLIEKLDGLCRAPETAILAEAPFTRTKIVRDYLVYYRITPNHIEVLTIWDSRRNPKEFKL